MRRHHGFSMISLGIISLQVFCTNIKLAQNIQSSLLYRIYLFLPKSKTNGEFSVKLTENKKFPCHITAISMLTITNGFHWLVKEFVKQAEEIPKTQILLTSKEWKVISCLKSAKFGNKYSETGFERNRNYESRFYSYIHAKHNRMKSHWFFSLISQESRYEFHGIEKPQKSLHSIYICTCVEFWALMNALPQDYFFSNRGIDDFR